MTPKKLVRWDVNNVSISDFASPSLQNGSMESIMLSTSSLEFINSQLVAHGFTANPGLSLDGTSVDDAQRIVKCLLSMLGQRVVSELCSATDRFQYLCIGRHGADGRANDKITNLILRP